MPYLFLLTETTTNALAHVSPCLSLLSDQSWRFTMWPLNGATCFLLFGTVSNKLSFQWQLPSVLLASLHLNNYKTYILKYWVILRPKTGKKVRKLFLALTVLQFFTSLPRCVFIYSAIIYFLEPSGSCCLYSIQRF